MEQAKMQQEDALNQRDNETKILIAQMQAYSKNSEDDGIIEPEYSQEAKDKLMESIRQFDERIKLDRERLEFDKDKARSDAKLKEKFLITLLNASLILLKNILNALICLITSFRIITNKYSMINN